MKYRSLAYLLFAALSSFSLTVWSDAADKPLNSNISKFSSEAVAACNGLNEADDCQIHSKGSFLNGICKMKAISIENIQPVCILDTPSKASSSSDSSSDETRSHKHKRH